MEIAERLMEIRDETPGSNASFERSIGVASGYIKKMVDQGSSPSATIIANFMLNYPQYNLEWLLTGTGEKFRKRELKEIASSVTEQGSVDKAIEEKVRKELDNRLNDIEKLIGKLISNEIEKEIKKTLKNSGDLKEAK